MYEMEGPRLALRARQQLVTQPQTYPPDLPPVPHTRT
jgi:hypothetical protein